MRIIQKLLSSRAASVICFVFALGARIAFLRVFIKIGPDKAGLILITKNLLSGNGITVNASHAADLALIHQEPFVGWPPAYNFFLAPALWVFKDNFMLAALVVDIFFNILFFIYLRKLLLLIGFPVWIANCFLVFQGLFIHPYFVASSPTDFIGMTLLVMAIFHIVKITAGEKFSDMHTWLAALFLIAAALTRYQYMPVSFILAALLIWQGYRYKINGWKTSGLAAATSVLIVVASVLLLQKFTAGSFAYVGSQEAGYFPENLLSTHPFVVSSFVNLNFYVMQLSSLLHTEYEVWPVLAKVVTFVVAIGLITVFFRWYIKKGNDLRGTTNNFWLFGGVAALVSVGVLIALSISRSSEMGPPMFRWTFVMSARYFSFAMLLVAVFTWYWLFVTPTRSAWKKILTALLVFTAMVEVAHGMYYLGKTYSAPLTPVSESAWERPDLKFTRQFILQEQAKGNKVVVSGFTRIYGFVAGWYGAAGYFDIHEINDQSFSSSEPTSLLVVVDKRELDYIKSFSQRPGVQLIHTGGDYYFYTLNVAPATNTQ
jgi:hypothetical protein